MRRGARGATKREEPVTFVRARFLYLAGLCIGCSPESPAPSCPSGAEASFVVVIEAGEEPLPAAAEVRVDHGGGCELYRVGEARSSSCDGTAEPGVLFCEVTAKPTGAGGAAGAPSAMLASQLRCDLWTQSAVSVHVLSPRHEPTEHQLRPKVNDCGGTETVEEIIELVPVEPTPEPRP